MLDEAPVLYAEITRLRNELHIMEVWSARIIAGTQQDVIEIARLRAEVKRLKAVEADYDLHEREMIDLEEDNGRLTAENERLRAALLPFASINADDGHDHISSWPDTVIVRCEASVRELKAARAALGEK